MTTDGARDRVVVVGTGLAGLRAAERLRELGFTGEIIMIGEERRRPYHRPALSKQLLTGKLQADDLAFATYSELDCGWRPGTRVLQLDPKNRVLMLPGREELTYDGLIIASGVQPRHLPGVPRHDPRIHVLRTVEDAEAIKANLAKTKGRVVVIGTGFTGCELASSLREMKREVTLIGRGSTLLGGVLGEELGMMMNELHLANGVDLELGAKPVSWHATPEHIALALADGRLLTASCVVLAVGSVPNTEWLAAADIDTVDGVLCEATCHVAGIDDVVAAGDVARWPNLRFTETARRCEHWLNAIEMGRAAAENLMAGRDFARPFVPIPRFWSEQHGKRVQGAGIPALAETSFYASGDRSPRSKPTVAYFRDGVQIAVVCVDQPRAMLILTEKLTAQLPVPAIAGAAPQPRLRPRAANW
ncbi:MAG: ferredoxin reductase [Amycolatopsis sp.]|jgi:NADPH-dependent 2,4-dienoyl-CoA reductase/sulfur reductase-like enzyme|uniref:NAD(P)/FAD-dependent oxidoreductase n=1 Tax=Amycolatopsis sp. TaxID=37632 RepID=UPI0026156F3E|nr:FAD/NAD(P)-binding oxidoreductase [Amycolatopsis sp.]MCU1684499.1 ferredoxin reductase [Amycolatopsis sp.]